MIIFVRISKKKIKRKGDGLHTYKATDLQKLLRSIFYRILQTDRDGRVCYSPVVKINATNAVVKIYPTVFTTGFNIIAEGVTAARLTDVKGKLIKDYQIICWQ